MTPLARAAAVLQRAHEARAFSAVSAEVGDLNGRQWAYAAGHVSFDCQTAVDEDSVFDLASLTKVIATTTIALLLNRRGVLDLDARVAAFLPEWSGRDRADVTVRDLLEHASGLPAYREYFRQLAGLDAYVTTVAAEPLEYRPRTRAIYSDLGFIILGALLERIERVSLDAQFEQWKTAAQIADDISYETPQDWRSRTVVTGFDAWRGRTLQGEVHDENAAALGGVAAHAGLFGTAAAVGAAARWWLRQLASADAQRFAQRSAVAGSSRALGWDTMLPTSSCGEAMADGALGHTGFTGTSLWLDPARGRYFVLLTNRVLASRSGDVIQQVRREFHNAAHLDLS